MEMFKIFGTGVTAKKSRLWSNWMGGMWSSETAWTRVKNGDFVKRVYGGEIMGEIVREKNRRNHQWNGLIDWMSIRKIKSKQVRD